MVNVNVNGRLGADAELRTTKGGEQYVTFRMATNEFNRKTKENETIWMSVTFFGKRALTLLPHLKKGSSINVMGEERVSLFKMTSGEYTIIRDVFADRVEFIGSGNNRTESSPTPQVKSAFTSDVPFPVNRIPEPQVTAANIGTPPSNDDLPF